MKKLIIAITLMFGALSVGTLGANSHAFADTKDQIQQGVCGAAGQASCQPGDAGGNLQGTVTTVINILSAVAGVAAVIMIIVGGLRYVTSAGNADAAKNAKNTLLYAVVGLVVVAMAQLIVHFVLHTTTSATDCVNGKTSTGQKCG